MKLITSISAISIILFNTTSALALSCTREGFDMESTFKANELAGKNVVYVMGRFSGQRTDNSKPGTKPVAGSNAIEIVEPPKETTSNLLFSGKLMTRLGAKPFKQTVKITSTCLGPWCGNIPGPDQTTIAALTKTLSGYKLTAGPCDPNTFPSQVNKDWKKLKILIK